MNKLSNTLRLFFTVKYIKPLQVYYQLFYRFRKKILPVKLKKVGVPEGVSLLSFSESITSSSSYKDYTFTFLNKSLSMTPGDIEWDNETYGKLWAYNLNYFEFLSQEGINTDEGICIIREFISSLPDNKNGLEPYPISLRGIFWIKFLSEHKIVDKDINDSLYAQYQLLMQQIEYHLLGNHLLENGFSLLFGAVYFRDPRLLKKAKQILQSELEEQVLKDGGHFELSPMYHQIILYRVLDSINLLQNNDANSDLLQLLVEKATLMLGWLETITFKDGTIPMVNDSAWGIAPTSGELFKYAERLNLDWTKSDLSDSGYRKFISDEFELFVDCGNIGPDYIPGHAHSDIGNFILHVDGKPLITEVGTSTYEKNDLRNQERSTASHNTVIVQGVEQSEVWGGFRVGRRARIVKHTEDKYDVRFSHNGYNGLGISHERSISLDGHTLAIFDELSKESNAQAFLHFAPGTDVKLENGHVMIGSVKICFSGALQIKASTYKYADGFNKYKQATKVVVDFKKKLKTEINVGE